MRKTISMKKLSDTLYAILASRWFWRISIGWFIIQSVYIAVTGRFAMAFDEQFHLAAIQQYAQVLAPWSVTQPPGPAELSAFTADGSYLYHYLASWPYRLLSSLTNSETLHIVSLRLLDVAVMTAGFYVYRRLLRILGLSPAISHAILAVILFMPMTSWLAGQLTYDTLFFTLAGLSMVSLVRLVQAVDSTDTVPLPLAAWSLSLLLLTSQVKYAFLPAALAAGVYVLGLLVWKIRIRHTISWSTVWRSWTRSLRTGAGMVAVGVVLLSGVLFLQRYGMNAVQYGTPVPSCETVLGHERCLGFGPYARDTRLHGEGWYEELTTFQKLGYPITWYKKMITESYFAVGPLQAEYPTVQPLPTPYAVGFLIAVVGLVVLVVRLPSIIRGSVGTQLALAIVGGYVLALFAINLKAYLYTAVPVSIHGRYVLPFLPLVGYLVYVALRPVLSSARQRSIAIILTSVIIAGSFYGGGIGAYVIGSDDQWYWPEAADTSRVIRSITERVVVH